MSDHEAMRLALLAWLESQHAHPGTATAVLAGLAGQIIGKHARGHDADHLAEGIMNVQGMVLASALDVWVKQ